MREVLQRIRRIGPKDLSVLIQGPVGSGKDLVARSLHEASPRRDGPFVVVNVPTVKPELFEAELFGHVRGAFTGAEEDRAGLLLTADHGTVYFDEIDGMDRSSQAGLLRCLDRREVRPLGGGDVHPIDVRFVFSTTRDLRRMTARGLFREDLYWRIAQAEITVPSLRRRREDLPQLAALLLRKHWRIGVPPPDLAPEVLQLLSDLTWPGNVRQLETVLLRTVLAWGGEKELTADALRAAISSPGTQGLFPEEVLEGRGLEELHRELDIAWLRRRFVTLNGNVSAMADSLGITRASLYKWLRRLGVDLDLWRREASGAPH
jgi:DNA-binding NtrC family response regulator